MHTPDLLPPTRLRHLVIVTLVLLMGNAIQALPTCTKAALVNPPSQAQSRTRHLHPLKTRHAAIPQASSSSLVYNNGPTMRSNSTTYAIFWEPPTLQDGVATKVSPTYNSLIKRYFNDIGGSGVYNNNTQYYDMNGHIVNSSTPGGAWIDTSAYPASDCIDWDTPDGCLSDAKIQAEVSRAMAVNGWTSGLNHLFFVFLSKNEGTCADLLNCAFTGFCGYHYFFTGTNNQTILYANIPYLGTNLSNCGVATSPNNDFDADSAINVLSHEHMEAVTDPQLNAWYDASGNEIGDKCAWKFGSVNLDGNQANVQWNSHYYIVQQEWSNALGGCTLGASAQPVSTLYIGSDDGSIYELKLSDGSQLWRYATGKAVFASPIVANGIVYAGSLDHYVYAINATNGVLLWRYLTGGAIYSSPTAANGVVYIGSNDGSVYALNATKGTAIWHFQGANRSVMMVAAVVNSVIYASSSSGNIYALRVSNGSQIWSDQVQIATYAVPAIVNNMLYLGLRNGKVCAFKTVDGSQTWCYSTGSYIARSLAAVTGIVYVGTFDTSVYALNANTGALIWHVQIGGEVNSIPGMVNGMVYVGAWDGYLYALNAAMGTQTWRFPTNDRINSSPTIVNGIVYFGSNDNYLYAVNANTGVQSWRHLTGAAIESSPFVNKVTGAAK